MPDTVNEIDQFLENKYVVMPPGWDVLNGIAKSEDSSNKKEIKRRELFLPIRMKKRKK